MWNSLTLYQIVLGGRDGVNRRKGTKKVTFGTGYPATASGFEFG